MDEYVPAAPIDSAKAPQLPNAVRRPTGALRRESRPIRPSSKSLQLSLHLLQTRLEGPAHARADAVPSGSPSQERATEPSL
jgi:hypothetical protein